MMLVSLLARYCTYGYCWCHGHGRLGRNNQRKTLHRKRSAYSELRIVIAHGIPWGVDRLGLRKLIKGLGPWPFAILISDSVSIRVVEN